MRRAGGEAIPKHTAYSRLGYDAKTPLKPTIRKVGHKEAQNVRDSGSNLPRAYRRNGGSFAAPEPLCLFVATHGSTAAYLKLADHRPDMRLARTHAVWFAAGPP